MKMCTSAGPGPSFEVVDEFSYLGAVLSSDGETTKYVAYRIMKASNYFGCFRTPTFHCLLQIEDITYRCNRMAEGSLKCASNSPLFFCSLKFSNTLPIII